MNNRRAASSEAVYNTELQVYTDFSINVQHHLRPNYEVKHHFFRFAYVRLFEGHFGGQCFSKCTSNPLKPMKHEYYQTETRLLCNYGDYSSLLNVSKEHAYNRIKLTSDGIKTDAQIQCLHTDPVSTHAVGMIGLDCFIGTGIE